MSDKVRRRNPPPVKCKATSKRTGNRCGRWAVPGNVVCVNHGGFAGPHGRPAAEELHAVRRIEALVTDQVHRQMAAQGWDVDALDDPPRLPQPHDGPSEDQVSDEEMTRVIQRSMSRAVDGAVAQFQALMAARRAAEAAAPQPVVIPGEVVQPDPLAEDITEPPSQDSKVAGSGVAPAQTASPQARPRRITTTLGIQAGDLR